MRRMAESEGSRPGSLDTAPIRRRSWDPKMDVDYRHLLQLLHAYLSMIPSWLQVVLSYYLAIVLTSWGRNRIAAKKRFLPAVIGFAIAGLLALRATSILMAFLSD